MNCSDLNPCDQRYAQFQKFQIAKMPSVDDLVLAAQGEFAEEENDDSVNANGAVEDDDDVVDDNDDDDDNASVDSDLVIDTIVDMAMADVREHVECNALLWDRLFAKTTWCQTSLRQCRATVPFMGMMFFFDNDLVSHTFTAHRIDTTTKRISRISFSLGTTMTCKRFLEFITDVLHFVAYYDLGVGDNVNRRVNNDADEDTIDTDVNDNTDDDMVDVYNSRGVHFVDRRTADRIMLDDSSDGGIESDFDDYDW